MIVKTKKYQLPTGKYIKFGLNNILKEQWWVLLIAITIASMAFVIWSIWWIIGAAIAYLLYWLFWLIQFTGVTQMEQNKILFDKLSYEISSQQIMIKVNTKQGMPIKWENIKRATVGKDYFLLMISKAQLIHLPFRIFNSENERKFIETILKRKNLVKSS